MNEQDRTDLERLIAAARPAGPSGELDARVLKAIASPSLLRSARGEQRTDRRRWLSVAASALVAAGIGFLGGRMSAGDDQAGLAQKDPPSVIAAPSEPLEEGEQPGSSAPNAVSPKVTTVPLDDERLVSLFLRPRSREGLLGAGPVRVETSHLP